MAAMFVIAVIILNVLSSSFSQVLDCDFDNAVKQGTVFTCTCNGNSCQLVQSSSDQFDWLAYSGPTPSSDTGPDDDHTRADGTGLYVYSEASDNNPGSQAELSTPSLSLSGPACLSFWYHMKGEHIGTFEVSFTYLNGTTSIVWEKTGAQGDEWIESVIALPSTVTIVTFNTLRGGSSIGMPFGDIALDDVLILEELCPGATAGPTIMPTDAATTSNTDPRTSTTTTDSNTNPPITTTDIKQTTRMSHTTTQTPEQSTAGSSSTVSTVSTPSTSRPASSGDDCTLWGLDETLWIIILVVAGAVILILLVIVCVQACAMRRMRTARIVRQSDDYSNIEAYNRDQYPGAKQDNFINAYDNEGMAPEDKTTTHPNGGGIH